MTLPTKPSLTPAEVLEIDRQNILAMAESGGRLAARIGKPREWNSYPDNGLHDEQREAWLRGYDAEKDGRILCFECRRPVGSDLICHTCRPEDVAA